MQGALLNYSNKFVVTPAVNVVQKLYEEYHVDVRASAGLVAVGLQGNRATGPSTTQTIFEGQDGELRGSKKAKLLEVVCVSFP